MQSARATVSPRVSYQVIREYRLFGEKNSAANSSVVAEVNFRPPASKAYTIQSASGSTRGQQLVRTILDREVTASADTKTSVAISRENYNFTYIGEAALDGRPCYLLGLSPKRKDSNLISGQVWVEKTSFLVRQIEGDLEKTPSWWLKKVRVKLEFADMGGIRVQTNMEATADVRIVGPHTLTSRILDYRRQDEVASIPTPARPAVGKR